MVGQGWYLITYGLGIYILNLFLAFLTPKVDPVTMQSDDDDDGGLPTNNQEEFRPFIRRLPEFKFWYSMSKVSGPRRRQGRQLCRCKLYTEFPKIEDFPYFGPPSYSPVEKW